MIQTPIRGEFFINDLVSIYAEKKLPISTICGSRSLAFGVNDQKALSQATSFIFRKKANELMKKGVIILDPNNTYIEDDVKIDPASLIYPNCYIRGNSHIKAFCAIEPHCFISNVIVSEGTIIPPFSHLKNKTVSNSDNFCKTDQSLDDISSFQRN